MSIGPDIIPTPVPPPGSPCPDDAAAWDDRRLAILSELAEAGLEIALALKARIVETAPLEPGAENAKACADLTRAFDRASRAVRLNIALRDRVLKDAPHPQVTRGEAHEPRNQRAERVRRIVRRVVNANFSEGRTRETLDRHVSERLHDRDITGDLADRPIGALVARICADLGLMPRWLDFAEEAWAQAEIAERPPGSPYAAWPDLPPEAPDPEDLDDDPEDEDEPDDPGGGGP